MNKHICATCGLTSQDGNLWCQRAECSASHLNRIYARGDRLGDIEIRNLLRVFHTAAMYEAERNGEQILLKVAHADTKEDLAQDMGYGRYLKNEAFVLKKLAENEKMHPMLPTLLPPYLYGNRDDETYGRIGIHGELRYYVVFQYVKGQFLRDYLAATPFPPYRTAAWLIVELADVIAMLHETVGIRHLSLSPDIILVRTDALGLLRPMLFDLGLHKQPLPKDLKDDNGYYEWLGRFVAPAYTAPELFSRKPTAGTDIYGLGLLLYEMLAGQPAYDFATKTSPMIRALVQSRYQGRDPLNRPDLGTELLSFVERTLRHDPQERFATVQKLHAALTALVGAPPVEPRRLVSKRQMVLTAALLGVVIVLVLIGVVASLGG